MPPADPSEDELARHWTLSSADFAEIAHCRGPDHRRRFALQLLHAAHLWPVPRRLPASPAEDRQPPVASARLAAVLFLDRPGRAQTERAQSLRIRRYLGLRSFDHAAAADLRDWLRQGAVEGRSAAELLARAEDKLRDWLVMLPAAGTLEQIVVAEVTHATPASSRRSQAGCRHRCARRSTCWSEVPEGDARSSLFRLKDYPKSASAAVIKGDTVRLRLIEELLGTGGELDDLDPRIVRQLRRTRAPLRCRRSQALRQAHGAALVACYLVEARKTLLDQIVEMNDLFLTAMNRKSRSAVEKRRKTMRQRARDGLHRVLGGVDALAKANAEQTVGVFRDEVNAAALVGGRGLPRLRASGGAWASTPCCRATARCANTCQAFSRCRSRLPPAASRCSGRSTSSAGARCRRARAAHLGRSARLRPGGLAALPHRGRQARPPHLGDLARLRGSRSLRAGSLFLAQSHDHVSFWSLVHDDRSWQASHAQAYPRNYQTDPQSFLAVRDRFDQAARAAADGLTPVTPRSTMAGSS